MNPQSKSATIAYWGSTAFLSVMMTFSAYAYLATPMGRSGFAHLGFPDYFRVELAVAKILGAIVLLVPAVPAWLKEWAYAGFFITFVSALIAHNYVDGLPELVGPTVALIVLFVSRHYFRKRTAVVSAAV